MASNFFFLFSPVNLLSTLNSSPTLSTNQNNQGRVRVALNDANRGRKEWETATNEGAAAATEWANAALHEA